jgi:hypothetical protein
VAAEGLMARGLVRPTGPGVDGSKEQVLSTIHFVDKLPAP